MGTIEDRTRYMLYNSIASFARQIIAIICGLIVPRLIIDHFGSAANGTISSMSQFISITALIQGGVSGATRVAFYKPVAMHDRNLTSKVYVTSRLYFRRFALFLFAYIIVLASIYEKCFKSAFDYRDSFLLVVIIGSTAVAEYLFGITNELLLFADQKGYINSILIGCTTIISSLACVVMIRSGASMIAVKLIGGSFFTIRPVILQLIVKHKYRIDKNTRPDLSVIGQRHSALAKSIAYYVHTSTDTLVITAFLTPVWVSVYAVHRYVTISISSIVSSVLGNTEVVFGQLFAKKDFSAIDREFYIYDLLSKILSGTFFFTAMILITPFVEYYTSGVKDVSYYHPVFAVLLCSAEMIYCMSLTYNNMVMGAGHIKQTKWISITEAMINIVLSVVLVFLAGIEGVAIGTFVAFVFNTAANLIYVKKNIYDISVKTVMLFYACNLLPGYLLYALCIYVAKFRFVSLFDFAIYGIIVFLIVAAVELTVNSMFFKEYSRGVVKKIRDRYGRTSDMERS